MHKTEQEDEIKIEITNIDKQAKKEKNEIQNKQAGLVGAVLRMLGCTG